MTEREPFPLAKLSQHPLFTGELIVSGKGIGNTLEALAVAAAQTGEQQPDGPELVVRAMVRLTEGPIGESRAMFAGSPTQIRDDIAFVHALGAAELHFDLSQMPASHGNAQLLDLIARLSDLVPAAMRMAQPAFAPVGVAA